MASRASQHPVISAAMPAAVAVLLITSLLPARFTGWVDGLSQLAFAAVTPISHPLTLVSRWLAPPDRGVPDDELARARAEAERYELLWRQQREEAARLRRVVEDLQAGRAFRPSVPIDVIAVPVVAVSSDPTSSALVVRAGAADGVTELSTVAVTRGTQLVGRVTAVGASMSTVLPINDPQARQVIEGVIITEEGPDAPTIRCILLRAEDGRLVGDAEVLDATPVRPNPPSPEPGMPVRLRDGGWPESAQMLVVGEIESIQPDPERPLRPTIIVRPTSQLRRLSEVILRIPIESAARPDREPTP